MKRLIAVYNITSDYSNVPVLPNGAIDMRRRTPSNVIDLTQKELSPNVIDMRRKLSPNVIDLRGIQTPETINELLKGRL